MSEIEEHVEALSDEQKRSLETATFELAKLCMDLPVQRQVIVLSLAIASMMTEVWAARGVSFTPALANNLSGAFATCLEMALGLKREHDQQVH